MSNKNQTYTISAVTLIALTLLWTLPVYASNSHPNYHSDEHAVVHEDNDHGHDSDVHGNSDKNPGNCDQNGSTGDKNGKPCNPGNNQASVTGCTHGEPDCVTLAPSEVPCTPTPTVAPTATPTPTVAPTATPTVTPTPTVVPAVQATSSTATQSVLAVLAPTGNFLSRLALGLEALGAMLMGVMTLLGLLKKKPSTVEVMK